MRVYIIIEQGTHSTIVCGVFSNREAAESRIKKYEYENYNNSEYTIDSWEVLDTDEYPIE